MQSIYSFHHFLRNFCLKLASFICHLAQPVAVEGSDSGVKVDPLGFCCGLLYLKAKSQNNPAFPQGGEEESKRF